jgi:hypothetical protein
MPTTHSPVVSALQSVSSNPVNPPVGVAVIPTVNTTVTSTVKLPKKLKGKKIIQDKEQKIVATLSIANQIEVAKQFLLDDSPVVPVTLVPGIPSPPVLFLRTNADNDDDDDNDELSQSRDQRSTERLSSRLYRTYCNCTGQLCDWSGAEHHYPYFASLGSQTS